jgi:plasmid maintenance system antidote protein VapI
MAKSFSFPRYCRSNHISYAALAAALGVSRSYACQLRLGRKPLTIPMARRIQAAYGLSLDVLLAASAGTKGRKR